MSNKTRKSSSLKNQSQKILLESLSNRSTCGDLATPLVTSWVYSTTCVQYLYISFYLSDNKPVLSYLLLRLLLQW